MSSSTKKIKEEKLQSAHKASDAVATTNNNNNKNNNKPRLSDFVLRGSVLFSNLPSHLRTLYQKRLSLLFNKHIQKDKEENNNQNNNNNNNNFYFHDLQVLDEGDAATLIFSVKGKRNAEYIKRRLEHFSSFNHNNHINENKNQENEDQEEDNEDEEKEEEEEQTNIINKNNKKQQHNNNNTHKDPLLKQWSVTAMLQSNTEVEVQKDKPCVATVLLVSCDNPHFENEDEDDENNNKNHNNDYNNYIPMVENALRSVPGFLAITEMQIGSHNNNNNNSDEEENENNNNNNQNHKKYAATFIHEAALLHARAVLSGRVIAKSGLRMFIKRAGRKE